VRGSNSIEGYNVTIDDAIAAVEGEEPLDPKDEAWLAVSGYRDAMTFVLQKANDGFFTFSAELLKALHFMMLSYDLAKNPGRWRPGPIFVRNESTGERVYEGPEVENVAPLVDELLDDLNAKSEGDASNVIRAAMAHLNLVMIHPFSDGNGRMGRCLQTLVLARGGVTAPFFSSIEEYLGRNTQAYYDVLAEVGQGAWHPDRSAKPWIRFCLTAHYRQATTLLKRTREIEKLCDEIEIIVRKAGLPERSVLALADAALGYKVRNATYRNTADVTTLVAGRDLLSLARAGLLEPRGEKRGRYYVATQQILSIRRKLAEPKSIPDPFVSGDGRKPQTPDTAPNPRLPGLDEAGD
jgi:Fic family protein